MNVRVIIKLAEQGSIKLYYFQEAIKLIFLVVHSYQIMSGQ